jgi:hypothetical protein
VDQRPYSERLSSARTEALFLVLSGLSLAVFGASRAIGGPALTAALSLGFFLFFFFYSLNYRVLHIRITSDELRLRFGLISWKIPRGNVNSCSADTVSLWRIGGAGIHFTSIGGRYRAMFNFLEHPRVVVGLRSRAGLVRDVVFSTRHPGVVIGLLQPAYHPPCPAPAGG